MSNYWTDRRTDQLDFVRQQTEDRINRELKALYKDMAISIKRDIEKLYDKFDKRPEDILVNDLYKNNQYYYLLSHVNQLLQSVGEKEIKILDQKMLKLYKDTSQLVSNEKSFQVGFDDDIVRENVLNAVWCPDGKHWTTRVWQNKEKIAQAVEQGITDCVSRGLPQNKVIGELVDTCNMGRYQAERLVRTELTYIQNQATRDTYEREGITKYEYLASDFDDECAELNGQIFSFDEAIIGVNFPPAHPNCRCTILPVLEDE